LAKTVEEVIEAAGILDEDVFILGGDEVVGAELACVLALARRVAEHGDVGAESMTELHAHVAQAQADHGKIVAGF
jgi:hypothetical protein